MIGFINLKKKVSSSVVMCEPSTSASVMMMMRWYRRPSILNCSSIPTPKALIRVTISLLPSMRSRRALSTFNTLPLRGKIACDLLSRPPLAEPPAESPSTMYSSESAGFLLEQSANLPGKPEPSNTPLRIMLSRAARAALRARAANKALPTILRPTAGCSSM